MKTGLCWDSCFSIWKNKKHRNTKERNVDCFVEQRSFVSKEKGGVTDVSCHFSSSFFLQPRIKRKQLCIWLSHFSLIHFICQYCFFRFG